MHFKTISGLAFFGLAMAVSTMSSDATYVDPACAHAVRAVAIIQGPVGSPEYNEAISQGIEACEQEIERQDNSYQKWLDNFCASSGKCYVSY